VLRADASVAGAPAEAAALVEEAERRGLERALVTETASDPFQVLAVAAARTKRIQLGTGIAVALARTPMTLAYSAWTLQALSSGRAVIGVGSQVERHIARRFAMPWSRPAARMAEVARATRAIWDAWQDGVPLDFRGEFYTHTHMPGPFNPGPLDGGPPPLLIAAVGPLMARVAGEVGDGVLCHPLTTPEHLRTRLLPEVSAGRSRAEQAGEPWAMRGAFEVAGAVFAAVGRGDQEIAAAVQGVRERIAFYAATPAYRAVLDDLGLHDLHERARGLARTGQWQEAARLVDDDVLHTFAVVGTPAEAAREIQARFRGVLDRVSLVAGRRAGHGAILDTLAEIQTARTP
jgi:probable F420-dependent oxidoreductase